MTRTTTTRSLAPDRRNKILIGGVVALAVIVSIMSALVLSRRPATAADEPTASPTPVVTPEPTESPQAPQAPQAPATPEPSEEPSQTPVPQQPVATPAPAPSAPAQPSGPKPVVEAPDGVLPPGGIVRVVIDGLRLREGPGLDADQQVVLSRGQLLIVGYAFMVEGFGPTEKDGLTWIPVRTLGLTELPGLGGEPLTYRHGTYGWVAIGEGSTDFVELVPARCPDGSHDLATLSSMTEWERLACFGNRSITLEGVVGCGGCGGFLAGKFEPEWLATPMNYEFLSVDPNIAFGPITLHYRPGGLERIPSGSIARVTGHFADATAADCVISPGEPAQVAIDDALAEVYCSEQFVVDSYEILGEDPSFPWS